jgi:hypothetical protein
MMKILKYVTAALALVGVIAVLISATIYLSDDRVCILHAGNHQVTCTRIL